MTRFSTRAAAALAAGALLVAAACGDDDTSGTAQATGAGDQTADGAGDDAAASGSSEDPGDDAAAGPFSCDHIDEAAAAEIVGGVSNSTDEQSEDGGVTFTRPDGSTFTYERSGCELWVSDGTVEILLATPPDGVDLFEEFRWGRGDDVLHPVEGLGEGAFVDRRVAQEVQLYALVDSGVLMVTSRPGPGTEALSDEDLAALADVAIAGL